MMRANGTLGARPVVPSVEGSQVEMLIGLALVVIAGALIVFIIRTVQGNMGKA